MSENNCTEKRSAGFSIPVPWSKEPIRVRGLGTVMTLLLVAVSLMAYVLYEFKVDAKAAQIEVASALTNLAQSQNELSYLMTLTPDDRAKLKLEMPESLRRRTRDR